MGHLPHMKIFCQFSDYFHQKLKFMSYPTMISVCICPFTQYCCFKKKIRHTSGTKSIYTSIHPIKHCYIVFFVEKLMKTQKTEKFVEKWNFEHFSLLFLFNKSWNVKVSHTALCEFIGIDVKFYWILFYMFFMSILSEIMMEENYEESFFFRSCNQSGFDFCLK